MLNFTRYVVNLCLILALSACISLVETRGYVPEKEKIKAVVAGRTTRADVIESLGYPSSVSAFDGNTWLYIETTFEKKAFFDPKELESRVLEITFGDNDKVKEIKNYTLDDAQKMQFSTDTTPTYGHSVNAVQQMIGNIGRFNKK